MINNDNPSLTPIVIKEQNKLLFDDNEIDKNCIKQFVPKTVTQHETVNQPKQCNLMPTGTRQELVNFSEDDGFDMDDGLVFDENSVVESTVNKSSKNKNDSHILRKLIGTVLQTRYEFIELCTDSTIDAKERLHHGLDSVDDN